MARSSSIISVSIIGDARKLIGAVDQADQKTGGLVKSALKVGVAAVGVRKGFDLLGDSLAEADRKGDALDRLRDKLGDLADPLADSADNFTDIGATSADILELEAAYADLATSAGIAAPDIAKNAEALAASAAAAALVHDADPAQIMDAIGKAAGGSTRGLKPYGVDLTEAAVQQRALKDTGKDIPKQLTDTELAAARTALIIEGFAGQLANSADTSGDLGDKQDILGAKFAELGGKVGEQVEGPLADALDWIIDMVDAIPGAIEGWQMLGEVIADVAAEVLTPIARAADAVRGLLNLLSDANRAFQTAPGRTPRGSAGSGSDRSVSNAQRREDERNGLHSGMGGN